MYNLRTIQWLALSLIVTVLMLIAAVALGTSNGNVCPEQGKVESQSDGDLDDIVLDAGTEVCIFGANVQVNVTADGEATLRELLGLNKNVSHYTITKPPSTTTTTTEQETTTTTIAETTTTTVAETTTTSVFVAPLPTVILDSTTTTLFTPLPTLVPHPRPTTTEVTETTVTVMEELPFTGGYLELLAVAAAAALALGAVLVYTFRGKRA